MRSWGAVCLAVLALALAGCNAQQKGQAGDAGQRLRNETGRARQEGRQLAGKAGRALDNATITARVKAAMGASDRLQTSGIDVSTQNRVVTLSGTVPAAAQRALAERIAKDTVGPGVQVVNRLKAGGKK